MRETIVKKVVGFGKYDAFGTGRKVNACDVRIELRKVGGDETFRYVNGKMEYTGEKTPEYVELSICGDIWNPVHTFTRYSGQCLDKMAEFIKDPKFIKIYEIWKKWHLNGMKAGTPEQEAKVAEWLEAGNNYDFDDVVRMLMDCGLYEVEYTGKSCGRMYDHEPYRYGSGWIVADLPEDVIEFIKEVE